MKKVLPLFFLLFTLTGFGQTFEWRLGKVTYSATDPDGGGTATGSATFTLQIHTTGGSVSDITQLATGFAYQSASAVVPTTPGCAISANTPANISMSATFAAAGFTYTTVSQCNVVDPAIVTGGQTFDRRANGVIDNGSITIGTDWVDVFTVTLWTLGTSNPEGGYVIINSSEGGTPGEYTTYSVSNVFAQQFPANSLTYTSPLALSSVSLPVTFTRFTVQCSPTANTIFWNTASEKDNSHFEVEKSNNGSTWISIGRVNSNSMRAYQLTDKTGGDAQYRIKQVDLNGALSYTEIVRTQCGNSAIIVNLYPKPARDKMVLQLTSDKAMNTRAQVIDNYGRVVMSVPLPVSKGANSFTIQVGHLPQGQYYLRSTDENTIVNQRFTIAR